jgi:hypothetical protein
MARPVVPLQGERSRAGRVTWGWGRSLNLCGDANIIGPIHAYGSATRTPTAKHGKTSR